MDIIKYNFKTKVSEETFNKSSLKYQFIHLEKNYDRNFIIAYFWYVSTYYKGMLYKKPIAKPVLDNFLKYRKELLKTVFSELSTVDKNTFGDIGVLWPKGLEKYVSKKISLETFCFTELYVKNTLEEFEAEDHDYVFNTHKKDIKFHKFFVGLICNELLKENQSMT
jgi:hypothetical protein